MERLGRDHGRVDARAVVPDLEVDLAVLVEGAEDQQPLRGLAGAQDGPLVVTKILASGRTTTVGGLLGESTRLFRRRPRVVLGASAAARAQVLDLSLRSTEWAALDRLARTPLPVGIARTAADVAQRLRLSGRQYA